MAIGRISGPMLFSNLERQGLDLAIEGNLIYFVQTMDISKTLKVKDFGIVKQNWIILKFTLQRRT